MSDFFLQNLCLETRKKLKTMQEPLENFLNEHNLSSMLLTNEEAEILYLKDLFSDLRHLLVNIEEIDEKLTKILRNKSFQTNTCEQTLYEITQQVVNQFFNPPHDGYEEDGRHSYTNRDAIRFRQTVKQNLQQLIISLSKVCETLREDLAYYESDYLTKTKKDQDNSITR